MNVPCKMFGITSIALSNMHFSKFGSFKLHPLTYFAKRKKNNRQKLYNLLENCKTYEAVS